METKWTADIVSAGGPVASAGQLCSDPADAAQNVLDKVWNEEGLEDRAGYELIIIRWEEMPLPLFDGESHVECMEERLWDGGVDDWDGISGVDEAALADLTAKLNGALHAWQREHGVYSNLFTVAGEALRLPLGATFDGDAWALVYLDEAAALEALAALVKPPLDTPESALEALRLAHPQQGWALVSGSILGSVRPFGASIVVTRGEGEESEGWTVAISWAGETVGAQDADPVAAYRAALAKREARDAA